jgi:predicted enzyme related to lactoylglutathione lyase
MRNAILAMTLVLTFLTGRHQERPPKSPPADVGPGRIAWFDITTSNLAQAKEFYGKLFDWKFAPLKETELAVEIVASGVSIGTIRVAEGKISAFNGVVYVQVNDIQASCNRSKELGGTIVPGFPFDLPDGIGAIALVADPTGHPIGMYSRKRLAAPPVK